MHAHLGSACANDNAALAEAFEDYELNCTTASFLFPDLCNLTGEDQPCPATCGQCPSDIATTPAIENPSGCHEYRTCNCKPDAHAEYARDRNDCITACR